ncbi:LysR family transcriptional regulator [Pararhizobium qamdonense]|uniref:LysR family transcriptional regulator n=1 Tax=Pararhizobium qamdonense TaxID=3031126 RepID=UPI0023E2E305|nr:LysR family transcriptional regulator [Pararhizobium qamdonense]
MSPKVSQRLDIESLRTLCAIEDHGGITRAADYLGLSQSAVSHKVKRLEISLDCALLCRRSNAPLFTDAGKDLLVYAKRILGIHDEALRSLSKSPLRGSINLGMTEDTTCSDLSQILTRFTRLYPGITVRAQVRQSLDLLQMFTAGAIEIAIVQVFQHDVRPTDIVLFEDRLHWVKSPDLDLDLSDKVPFLSFDENCFYRRWAMDIAQEQDSIFRTVLECASAAGIVAGVNAGLGVALLSGRHVSADMEVIDAAFIAPPSVASVIRVSRKSRDPATEALVSEIKNEISRRRKLRVI